ncbi:trypsin-7-like [Onthophagus taurus]|uniref:trypsin-7-like n=1 Tax=Onthophagus taurus TaxID=166361 RepID=UPI0039BE8563
MYFLTITLFYLQFILNCNGNVIQQDIDGRIVGGIPANIEDFPYQISLQYRGQHACGGSIISSKFVVTAAHCTDGAKAESLSVRVGSTSYRDGGKIIQIQKIIQHPSYDNSVIDYDVSILELKDELEFNENVQAIKLAENDVGPNHFAVVSGWGTLKENGKLPSELQQVFVPILSNEECRDFYGEKRITDRMLCAGYTEGGHDSCQGDSGGPLVYKDTLIGIVSWGIGCARPNYPGVYTSIPKIHQYLNEYVI